MTACPVHSIAGASQIISPTLSAVMIPDFGLLMEMFVGNLYFHEWRFSSGYERFPARFMGRQDAVYSADRDQRWQSRLFSLSRGLGQIILPQS